MKAKARLIMSVKIWLVIYPSITLFLALFNEQLSSFPLYLRTLVLTISLVPWVTFIGIPLLDKLLGYWQKEKNKTTEIHKVSR